MNKIGLVAGFACLASLAFGQGGLTPPGAPAPSMKTLEQVEPRIDVGTLVGDMSNSVVISTAGSYYLSGNLTVVNTNGIFIASSDVSLDLNGFTLSAQSGAASRGIFIQEGLERISISNGRVKGFEYGIFSSEFAGWAAEDCRFERLMVSGCSELGIGAGDAARFVHCSVDDSGEGFSCGENAVLVSCVARNNQYGGISTKGRSVLTDCLAENNGYTGILCGGECILSGCLAYGNKGFYGILTHNESTLNGCVAKNNHGNGIDVGVGSTLRGCIATGNASVGSGFHSCGINASSGSTVIGCVSSYNSKTNATESYEGIGIRCLEDSLIKDCQVDHNSGSGIWVESDCRVEGNSCNNNGFNGTAAGIYVSGHDCRIENNTVTDNDWGIQVVNNGNFVVKNTASGNTTNYAVHVGSHLGAVKSSPVGADAWDNFEF